MKASHVWIPVLISIFCGFGATGQSMPLMGDPLAALTRPQDHTARRESSSNPDLASNGDMRSVEPGGTLVLAELEGPGEITHIWTTVGSFDPFYGRSLILRMYWDGAEHPSVEAPIGDFFGLGHGANGDYTSMVSTASSHGRARNCFWRMPFRKRARITVTNESKVFDTNSFYYHIDWRSLPELPEDTLYFHARYRQAMPAEPGNYLILDTTGSGHYVGTVHSVHQVETGWFGEGDEWFYIDGEELPSLRGTGTEDYFGHAWGFHAFSTPFFGVPIWEGYFAGDRVSAYRWHILDPIPFTKSLKVSIEHRGSVYTDAGDSLGGSPERPDWLSSVAYWYQRPLAPAFGPLPPAESRLAPYQVLQASTILHSATPMDAISKQGPMVDFTPGASDGILEFRFEAAKGGRHQINALLWESLDSGVYQTFLDGAPVGRPLELVADGRDPVWTSFDLHDLAAGPHSLRFEGRGLPSNRRALAAKKYSFGMVYLILLRLEDMEGYHQVHDRQIQKRK
ncbi:MAG: hypothetical protein GHCLOJNM_04207 [bacterium]|nr:hypothetical protein [bacterium]